MVEIRVWLQPGGIVEKAEVVGTRGEPPEPLRAFAESARRAVLISSPLPMPADRPDLNGGNLILTFRGAR